MSRNGSKDIPEAPRREHRILLLGSLRERRDVLASVLQAQGYRVRAVEASREPSGIGEHDLVLVDMQERNEALDRLGDARRQAAVVPVVVLAPEDCQPRTLLKLGSAGAYDCIVLEEPKRLVEHVERLETAIDRMRQRRVTHRIGEQLVGDSDKMNQVRRFLRLAADSSTNVLLEGESGTGKELAARAIHDAGSRSNGPFVALNCAAIPENLLESELFSHEKGSFTGAERKRVGAFEQADGGTLFLDEVGDMSPAFQAKLLRVLQPPSGEKETVREFRPVGAESALCADVRVIAASNADLRESVKQKAFRKDLHERLKGLEIFLPPLRERREDIPRLVRHFIERFCRSEERSTLQVDAAAMEVLQTYDWPANVRELEGVLRSIVSLKEVGDTIVLGDLPPHLFEHEASGVFQMSQFKAMDDVIADHAQRVLASVAGNKTLASRILKISRPRLDRILRSRGKVGDDSAATPEDEKTPRD